MIAGIAGAASAAARAGKDEPERIADAARQFESLLIAQILREASESGSGGSLGGESDGAGSQSMALAQEMLAQSLAAQGGLGLAATIAKSFGKR